MNKIEICKLVNNNEDENEKDYNYYIIEITKNLPLLHYMNISRLYPYLKFNKFKGYVSDYDYNFCPCYGGASKTDIYNTNEIDKTKNIKVYIDNYNRIYGTFVDNDIKTTSHTLFTINLLKILMTIDKNIIINQLKLKYKSDEEYIEFLKNYQEQSWHSNYTTDKIELVDINKFSNLNELIKFKFIEYFTSMKCLNYGSIQLIIKSKIIDMNLLYQLINKDLSSIYVSNIDKCICLKINDEMIKYDLKQNKYTLLYSVNNIYANDYYLINIKNIQNLSNINIDEFIEKNIINIDILQQQIKELQDNYLNLKSNFEVYTELINELRNENKELKKQVKDLKDENVILYSSLI